jgi:hypothetical protein
MKRGVTYRSLSSETPRVGPLRQLSEPIRQILFLRKKIPKVNGVRTFFRAYQDNQQLFLAKAKSPESRSIPITNECRIHLRSKSNHIAGVTVDSNRTDFTVVDTQNRGHVLGIKFAAPRVSEEGSRGIHLRFLRNCGMPSNLASLPLTECAQELSFPIKSVKNAILGDEDRNWQIAIRRISRESVEVRAKVDIDPICLFGIGIAIFLGKPPTR